MIDDRLPIPANQAVVMKSNKSNVWSNDRQGFTMLQLVYVSSVVGHPSDAEILEVSRRNNARDGIAGLLYSHGDRYLQVLEGPSEKVEKVGTPVTKQAIGTPALC